MMIEEIEEPIDVVAVFSGGKISPILFSWQNRRYNNLKVNRAWNQTVGDVKLIYFLVSIDNANLYEICYHTRNFRWSLVKVHYD